jgi:hypothetical protein
LTRLLTISLNNSTIEERYTAMLYKTAICTTVLLLTFSAFALNNQGFETPQLANGGYSAGMPAGWQGNSESISIHNPGGSELIQPTEGSNYIRIGSGVNTMSQSIGIIQQDTGYSLKVDVAVSGSWDWYRTSIVWLNSDGSWGDYIVDANHNTNSPITDGWITVQLDFHSFDSDQYVGKEAIVYLSGENVIFDNVRFSIVPPWDGSFNGNFEYNHLAEGASGIDLIPSGWNVQANDMCLLNPYSSEPLQPSDGDNMLLVNNGTAEYYPTGPALPQTRYSVDVDIALPSSMSFGWYQVRFIYFDTDNMPVTITEVNHNSYPIAQSDTWYTIHLEFTTSGSNRYAVGNMLRLQLAGQGVAYDNCRLEVTSERQSPAGDFYISSSEGSDFNDGRTPETAWESFANVSRTLFSAGDRILLKRGDRWTSQLTLFGSGSGDSPVELTAYGSGKDPLIEKSDIYSDKCIVMESPSNWRISNIELAKAKIGIYLRFQMSSYHENITIEDCYFRDMDQAQLWDPSNYNYELSFNTAVMAGGKIWGQHQYVPVLTNLTIRRCRMDRCTNTLLSNFYYPARYRNRFQNVILEDITSTKTYGAALFHINGGRMKRCYSFVGEDDFMPLGTTQGILQSSRDFVIEDCVFHNGSRQGGNADGCAFDFEGDTLNCVFRNNVCYNSDAASLLILETMGPNLNLLVEDCVFFDNCRDSLKWSGHDYELISWNSNSTGTLKNLAFYRGESSGLYSKTSYFSNFTKINVQDRSYSEISGLVNYWHFETDSDMQGWYGTNDLADVNVGQGRLNAVSTGLDPYIHSPQTWVVAATNPLWSLRMRTTEGDFAQLYFITHSDQVWNEAKSVAVPLKTDGSNNTYYIDMRACSEYKGVITQFRLDPVTVSGSGISIDYVLAGEPDFRTRYTSFYPVSFDVVQGSYISGDVGMLRQKEFFWYNPNDYIKVAAAGSPARAVTDYLFSSVPGNVRELEIELFDREDVSSGSIAIYAYDYQAGSWHFADAFDCRTQETTRTALLDEAAGRFVDNQGSVRLRISLSSSVPNSVYNQYFKLTAHEQIGKEGDMDFDGDVDLDDLGRFMRGYNPGIAYPADSYAHGADMNNDLFVDVEDFMILAANWLNLK